MVYVVVARGWVAEVNVIYYNEIFHATFLFLGVISYNEKRKLYGEVI